MYIFGQSSETVMDLYARSAYRPGDYYGKDEEISQLVDFIISPTMMRLGDPENLARLYKDMSRKDWFMALLDVKDYIQVKERAFKEFEDRMAWAKKMLVNIAKAGTSPRTAPWRSTTGISGSCPVPERSSRGAWPRGTSRERRFKAPGPAERH